MAKGYWIAQVTVTDPETYEEYKVANAIAFSKFGGRFVVRGGAQVTKEGSTHPRSVVIEFPNYEAALACYDSPEYQTALAIRQGISQGNLVIIEGYED